MLVDEEVSLAVLEELHADTADAMRDDLREQFPYQIHSPAYISGKGLVSRMPVVGHEWFEPPSGRTWLKAVVDVSGCHVNVFVVHLAPPEQGRMLRPVANDMEVLISRATGDTPTILAGDFNFVRPAKSYRLLLRAGFRDMFAIAGSGAGLTYPTRYQRRPVRLPRLVRIDYIWISKHFRPIASWLGPKVGSDHLPLLAEVELQTDEPDSNAIPSRIVGMRTIVVRGFSAQVSRVCSGSNCSVGGGQDGAFVGAM